MRIKMPTKTVFKALKNKYLLGGLVLFCVLWFAYSKYVSPTKVALINFRDFQYADILKAKNNPFIKVDRITFKKDKSPNLNRYTAIYTFGMGLNLDEAHLNRIRRAIGKGVKVYVYAATSAESDLTNLSGDDLKYVEGYFTNGGRKNLQALLNYTRRVFDKKTLFTEAIKEPRIIPRDVFFHLGEDNYFTSYEGYQKFYEEKGYFREGKSKVCLLTTNIGPRNANREHVDELIKGLEERGLNVYPMSGFLKRLDFIKEVKPALVILMPHGRLIPGKGDEAVAWLSEQNVPLLCPITIFSPYEEWAKSQQGMAGGIMSQSIVMPEIDGGIDSYPVSAQFKNEHGLYVFKPIPERVNTFCNLAKKWIELQEKQNSEKRIAIFYYKGPGLNAMVAGGLEVAPSLLALLKHLGEAGFDTGNLPDTEEELLEIIQKEGPVLGPYAKGSFQEYLEEGNPELVPAEKYIQWCGENLEPDSYKDIVRNYGEPPGEYMSVTKDGKSYIAVSRIKFGNIVILPQPLPAYGDNESQLIHGAKKAPPHPYVASYLWAKNGLQADAIMHFGTHGSLEFTPWKQLALSRFDWPAALIGDTPHVYIYVINNIGEALIAKRRSYAVLTSHLTPPFTESDLYGDLSTLHDKFHNLMTAEGEGLKKEYRKSIKEITIELDLHKDLGLKELRDMEITQEIIEKIHNHIHAIEQEKITRGLYTLGNSYEKDHLYETAKLMALDPLAYSMARRDLLEGKITREDIENAHSFDSAYRQKAFKMIDSILVKGEAPDSFLDEEDMRRLETWEEKHHGMSDDEFFASMLQVAGSSRPAYEEQAGEKAGKKMQRLQELILMVAPYEEKKDFLLSLQQDTKFKKVSAILDPQSLEKVKKIAMVVPAMKKQLEIVEQEEMKELITLMQDPEMRVNAFRYLKDKKIQEEIKREQEIIRKETVRTALNKTYQQDLFTAIDEKKRGEAIPAWERQRLIAFVQHVTFYLQNKDLANEIADTEKHDAKAVAAVLQSKKGLENALAAVKEAKDRVKELDEREKELMTALRTYRDTVLAVENYYEALEVSTPAELASVVNGLRGGYIPPSSGGDPVSNPRSVPTGRNLYGIDAEKMPTGESWKVGVKLAKALIADKLKGNGEYPKKVAFTLWGGEFVRSQGINLAQIFYLLGVEPVRNSRGSVHDVRLIPIEELKRPRIDVVVQTSGQFRDIAASRIYLINRAVKIASQANDSAAFENFVKEGTIKAEEIMKEKGLSPLDARLLSTARVFGGVNGNYGTGIMGLVESGDKWEDEKEIADLYMKNMGAVYTKEKWGHFEPGIFEAALQNTDTVVQPRSSNTWGPLSLDHVYEFMGGLNAVTRQVTGNDPDAYFNDLRNRNNPVVQGAKEAIWIETRTTLFNPKYIKDLQKGGASSAEKFAETFRNTYGWNVMKPEVIDREIWEGLYEVYIKDKHDLDIEKFFRNKNPYALQEMTAVMLETVRKGYWKPDEKVIKDIANLHAKLVKDHKAGCSGFVCDNAKLREMIRDTIDAEIKEDYTRAINAARISEVMEHKEGMKLKKEKINLKKAGEIVKENLAAVVTMLIIVTLFAAAVIVGVVKRGG